MRPSATFGFIIAAGFLVLQSAYAVGASLTQSTAIKSAGAIRGALIAAIYHKTCVLPPPAELSPPGFASRARSRSRPAPVRLHRC